MTGIEEKLWAETDTVMYGLLRRVVKKFNRLLLIKFRGKGDKPAFRVLIQGTAGETAGFFALLTTYWLKQSQEQPRVAPQFRL
ncbi:hypothetical protein AHV57_26185 [Salmonella enterica]|nr:hypothetical protein [Salmonella enterica]